MELGLHIANFTFSGGPVQLAGDLAALARTAEDAGFERITVMDHLWQIPQVGPVEHGVLDRVLLHTLVTGVVYRSPGLLAKAVTTLDVLSGGRAGLGIGAAWNEDESIGLGLDFPPTAERFERLEEAVQIVRQMWSDDDGPYEGRHHRLGRTMNSPQHLSRPHPTLMIGGGGERKTLRLVAKYADACNLFGGPDLPHKLEVLREHCRNEGRDDDTIEKTVTVAFDPGASTNGFVDQLRGMHDLGVTAAYLMVPGPTPHAAVEMIGAEVIPQLRTW